MKEKMGLCFILLLNFPSIWAVCNPASQVCPKPPPTFMMQQARTTGNATPIDPNAVAPNPITCPPITINGVTVQQVLVQVEQIQAEATATVLASKHIGKDDADCDGPNFSGWTGVICRHAGALTRSNLYAFACKPLALSTSMWVPS